MVKKAIQIDEKDNVATVTGQVIPGEEVEVLNPNGSVILQIKTSEDVAFGHKIAIKDLDDAVKVVKYGEVIGITSQAIQTGRWVHTHNVKSVRLDTSE